MLYRSRAIIAATAQPDGTVLVIDEGHETVLSADAFAARFLPATLDEVRAHANGNGHAPASAARELPPSGRAALVRATVMAPSTGSISSAPAPVKKGRAFKRPSLARRKLSPEQLQEAEADWKAGRLSIKEIADKFGVKDSALHWHAKRRRWGKRPDGNPAKRQKAKSIDVAPIAVESSYATGHVTVIAKSEPVRSQKDWDLGRKLWDEGKDVAAIAAAVGCTPSAVYLRSKEWPERPKGAQVRMRTCDSCMLPTRRDPCHHCGKARKKYWKDD